MNKLIIKVIGITLGIALFLVGVMYMCFSLFSPKTIAKIADDLGAYETAVKYMDREFKRSGEISDLVLLSEYAIKSENNGLIAEHLWSLLEHSSFKKYAESLKDGQGFYDYVCSKYVSSAYQTGEDKNELLDKAFSLGAAFNPNNAIEALIYECYENEPKDRITLEKILQRLENLSVSLSGENKLRAETAVENLTALLAKLQ